MRAGPYDCASHTHYTQTDKFGEGVETPKTTKRFLDERPLEVAIYVESRKVGG